MKKIGTTLLIAALGGTIALGGYKLFERNKENSLTFQEKQNVYYANAAESGAMVSSSGNPDFVQAAAAVSPGVVHIKVTSSRQQQQGGGSPFDMFEDFFGLPQQPRRQRQRESYSSGSGVIISPDGYIVTNNHVVDKADKIEVLLTDNRSFGAIIIGRDPNTDLALIKVNATNLPLVRLGDSDKVQVGEWVLAVGYPLSLKSTVTAGIVSAKGRQIGILGENQEVPRGYGIPQQQQEIINTAVESFIQTDAVINRGNSGGALVNAKGELIGINSAIASPTGTYAGYGFAIPVNLAKKILNDFKEFGSVKRGYIGVTFNEVNSESRKEFGLDDISGLYVRSVVKAGAAATAGIKEGDVLTKIEGRVITSSSDLQEPISRLRPGDKVKLTYKRDGKEKEVTVTLKGEETKAKSDSEEGSANAAELFNKLGAGFTKATDQQKKELGVTSGVIVSQIHRGGLFEYYGFEPGLLIVQINGVSVNSVDDIENALSKSKRYITVVAVPSKGNLREIRIPMQF